MSDHSELKRMAEAALNDNGDYVALSDYGMAVPPAVVLDLIAEVEALRSQVDILQSDANSWQSGYDEGRRMGTKTALDEREQLRKDAERYRWLSKGVGIDSESIDAAMSKGDHS